ncbi:MAG: DUF349 domain-containing protein [Thiotrichales bacterium]
MLSRLFKPKWQHKDPAIRLTAVAEATDPAIVFALANEDSDPRVRKAAIGRINRIDALLKLHAAPAVAGSIDHRLAELLIKHPETPYFPQFAEHLPRIADPALNTQLASRAHDPKLRRLAISLIDDQAILARCTAEDDSAEVRLSAAQRLNDEPLIRSALKQLGKKDKRTAQTLRERLDTLQIERERHARIAALVDAVTALGHDSYWQRDQGRFLTYQTEWSELERHATSAEIAAFHAASADTQQRLDRHRQTAESLAPTRDAKQDHCALVDAFAAELDKRHRISAHDADEINATLDTFQQDWLDLPILPETQEAPLANRFHAALKHCRNQVEALRRHTERGAQLERLIQQAEQLNEQVTPREQSVDRLETAWRAQPLPSDPQLATEYRDHFNRLLNQLRQRIAAQNETLQRSLAEIEHALDTIESTLASDQLGDAIELQKKVHAKLDSLVDVPVRQRQAIERRLRNAAPRIRELSGWRHWGTDRAREELIAEAEALVSADIEVPARARAVRALRERWKKLGEIDPAAARRLWERFDAACTEAYKPCQDQFHVEAEARERHREARALICFELESMAHETDWQNPDWRALDKRLHQLQNRWKSAGPVNRHDWETLLARYGNAIESVEKHLAPERNADRNRREALIQQLEEALTSGNADSQALIALARSAQSAWHPTVTGRRNDEQRLWQRFRAAQDAIYAHDRAQRDAGHAATQAIVDARTQLCEALEAQLAEPAKLASALPELKARWANSGDLPGNLATPLERRFERALKASTVALRQAQLEVASGEFRLLVEHHRALERIEQARLQGADAGEIAALDAAWHALAACTQSGWGNLVEQRYALPASDGLLEPHRLAREERLLDLEILLHLESPAAFAAQRMQRQVDRLAATLSSGAVRDHNAELQRIASEYCGIGAVAPTESATQAPRFDAIVEQIVLALARGA